MAGLKTTIKRLCRTISRCDASPHVNRPAKISRHSERGNVFFTLFGAVAIVGVLGAGIMATMRGPLSTMVEVNRRTQAESQMSIASKLAMVESVMQAQSGDCDADGYVEPVEYQTAIPSLAGGGTLPAVVGSNRQDPWGSEYGYCSWDAGPVVNAAGCGGGTQKRLAGTGVDEENYSVIAVFSAGPDRVFQSSCSPNGVVSKGGDDLVVQFDYATASAATGGLWKIKSGSPDTAAIEKNLDVTGSAKFSNGIDLTNPSAALQLGAASMLLPDQTVLTTCNPANDGLLRINTTTDPDFVEICDDPVGWAGVADGAPGLKIWTEIAANRIHFGDDGTQQVGIGTNNPGEALDVVGNAKLSGDLKLANGKGVLWASGANVTESTGDLEINANGGTGIELKVSTNKVSVNGDESIVGSTADASKAALDVKNSAATPLLTVLNDGHVGINTSSPNDDLDVSGTVDSSEYYSIDDNIVLKTDGTMADTILVGRDAGKNTTGDFNTIIGAGAGTTLVTGKYNILIGTDEAADVDVAVANANYVLNIGNLIFGDLKNKKVGIGTNNLTEALNVNGNAGISGNVGAANVNASSNITAGGTIAATGKISSSNDIEASGDLIAHNQIFVASKKLGPPAVCTATQRLDWGSTGWTCVTDLQGGASGGPPTLEDVLNNGNDAGNNDADNFHQLGADQFCNSDRSKCFDPSDVADGTANAPGSPRQIIINKGGKLGTDTTFVFSSGGYLGVGTASPTSTLHVVGTGYFTGNLLVGTNALFVDAAGSKVGIGDPTPDGNLKLDVEGDIGGAKYCDENGNNCFVSSDVSGGTINAPGSNTQVIFNSNGKLSGAPGLVYVSSGNVGIGVTSPTVMLDIKNNNSLVAAIKLTGSDGRTVSLQNYGGNALGLSGGLVTLANGPYGLPRLGALNGNGATTYFALFDENAAGIMAQRNSTTGQVYRLYNTYTDASNYERAVMDWQTTSNVFRIGTEAAGTGTVRNIALVGGRVGIGTTTPAATLDVTGTDAMIIPRGTTAQQPTTPNSVNGMIRYDSDIGKFKAYQGGTWQDILTSGTGNIATSLSDADGNTRVWVEKNPNEDMIRFDTAGSERMIITSTGKVGIGTSAPAYSLDIGGYGASLYGYSPTYYSVVTDSYNGITGFETKNTGSGSLGDARYTAFDKDGAYVAMAQPGLSNTNPLFGIARNTASYLFTNAAGAGVQRHLALGTVGGTDVLVATNNVERMRITSAGKVGIGTITPQATLDVTGTDAMIIPRGTTAQQPTVPNSVNGMIRYDSDVGRYKAFQGGSWQDILTNAPGNSLAAGANTQVQFNSNGSFAANSGFVYTSLGRVGIGTATPADLLSISGNGGSTIGSAPTLSLYNSDDTSVPRYTQLKFNAFGASATASVGGISTAGGGAMSLGFFTNTSSERMRITSAGNVGIGITTPNAPLSFGTGLGMKIALWDAGAGVQYGLGIQGSLFQILGLGDFMFGNGTSTAYTPYTTIKGGTGYMGLGTTVPEAMLDVNGMAHFRSTATFATGSATNPSITFSSDSKSGFYTTGANDLNIATAGTNRMTVTNAGRIGIGTASPFATLDVTGTDAMIVPRGTTAQQPTVPNSVNGMIRYDSDVGRYKAFQGGSWQDILTSGGGALAAAGSNSQVQFNSNGSFSANSGFVYTSLGNVGIGTNTPGATLDVLGSASNSAVRLSTVTAAGNVNLDFDGPIVGGSRQANGVMARISEISTGSWTSALSFSTRFDNNTFNEALRINNAGYLGIGTPTPGYLLDVASSGMAHFQSTALFSTGSATAPSITFSSDSKTGFYNSGTNQLSIATAGANRVTVDSAGNVGIGTTTPTALLTVGGTGDARATQVTGDLRVGNFGSSGIAYLQARDSSVSSIDLQLRTQAAGFPIAVMRLTSTGRVGIGTLTPAATFDVTGTDAMIVPRGTTAQQPTVPNSVNGMIRYDSDVGRYKAFQGGSWQDILTSGGGALAAAGSDRQIQFNSNGSFAAATPFVYSSLGYVGIGTSTPSDLLTVHGSVTDFAFMDNANSLSLYGMSGGAGAIKLTRGAYIWGIGVNNSGDLSIGSAARISGVLGAFVNNAATVSGYSNAPSQITYGFTGDVDTGMYSTGADTIAFGTGAIERARISATGNLGIGTPSPTFLLDVGGNGMAHFNSTANFATGSATAPSITFSSDSKTGFYNSGTNQLSIATAGANRVTVDSAGNVGIGTTTPTAFLDATAPISLATTGTVITTSSYLRASPSADSSANFMGQRIDYTLSPTSTANMTGNSNAGVIIDARSVGSGSGSINQLYGLYTTAYNGSSTLGVTTEYGIRSNTGAAAGTVANAYGVLSGIFISGTGSLTNAYGMYVANPSISGSGAITNYYGLYIANSTGATTNNYALYAAGGTSYFGGRVGIGTSTPAATLDVTGTDAMIVPRGTTAQTPTTPNSVNGMIRYDSDIGKFRAYQQGSWQDILTNAPGNSLAAGSDRQIQFNSNGSFSAASSFVYSSLGYLGVGTLSPTTSIQIGDALTPNFQTTPAKFSINDTPVNTALGAVSSMSIALQPAPASNSSTSFQGLLTDISVPSSLSVTYSTLLGSKTWVNYAGTGNVSTIFGTNNVANNASASATISGVYGSFNTARNTSTGTITASYGALNRSYNVSTGSIGTAYGTYSDVLNQTTGGITTAYGLYSQITNSSASGTIGTAYGLYLNKTNSGTITNNYGIYQADTSTNYLAGNLGIGTAAPTTQLSNTGSNIQDAAAGVGVSGNSIGWQNNASGYTAALSNLNTGSIANGLLVSIAGTASTNKILSVDSGGANRLSVLGTGQVGIGTATPAATLDVTGTDAMILPRGTTAQQPTGPNSVNGMIRYDSNVNKFKAYQGGSWQDILTSGGGALAAAGADRQIQFNSNGSFSAASSFVYSSLGNLGLGTLSPTTSLQIGNTLTPSYAIDSTKLLVNDTPATTTATTTSSLSVFLQPAPASNSSTSFQGITSDVSVPSSSSVTYSGLYGSTNSVQHNGTGNITAMYGNFNGAYNSSTSATVSVLYGSFNVARNNSTGAVTTSYGGFNRSFNISTGSMATAYGTYSDVFNNSTGAITTAYGMYSLIRNNNASATIGTAYGLYLTKTNNGTITNNYGIYQADASNNYFAGNIGIATSTPTYKLDVGGDARFTSAVHFANGSAAAPSLSFAADSDVGMYRATADALAFATNGSEVMRMISGGAVGIGTATPSTVENASKFTVSGSSASTPVPAIYSAVIDESGAQAGSMFYNRVSGSTIAKAGFSQISNGWFGIYAATTGAFTMPAIAIKNANNYVGINTNAPQATLDVTGTDAMILPRGTTAQQPTTPNSVNGMIRYDSDVNKFKAYQGGSWQDILTSGGGALAAAGSDRQIQFNSNGSFSAASSFVYSSLGNLGIGTSAPAAPLQIGATITTSDFPTTPSSVKAAVNAAPADTVSSDVPAILTSVQPAPSSSTSARFYGSANDINVPSSSTTTYGSSSGIVGNYAIANYAGTGDVTAFPLGQNPRGVVGTMGVAKNNSTSATVSGIRGAVGVAQNLSTGTATQAIGLNGIVQNGPSTGNITTATGVSALTQANFTAGTGTITNAYGGQMGVFWVQGNNITNAYGSYSYVQNSANTTATNAYAGYFDFGTLGGSVSTGTTTNAYGVYIGTIVGTNKYSLYAADITAPSYFAGKVGIGTSTPLATLDVTGTDAMIVPRGTTAQTPTTPNSVNGMIRYDSDIGKFRAYQGGSWQDILTNAPGNSLAAGSDRQIQFNSNGSFAAATPFVYSSLGYVGIGTASPSSPLHVSSSATGFVDLAEFTTTGNAASNVGINLNLGNSNGASGGYGTIRSGRWTTTDRGLRLIAKNAASYETSFIHLDGQSQEMYFATTSSITGTGTERMRITSTGNVGIGTATPNLGGRDAAATYLTVYNSVQDKGGTLELVGANTQSNAPTGTLAFTTQGFGSASAASIYGYRDVGNGVLGLQFVTGGANAMRIAANGNVGIGLTNPAYKLDVAGSGMAHFASTANFALGSASAPSIAFSSDSKVGLYGTGTNDLNIATLGTNRMTITSTGNVGIGTSSPAYPLSVVGSNSVAWIQSATINGGVSGGTGGVLVALRPTDTSTQNGGNIYAGRWSSTDRGMRLVGLGFNGTDNNTYVHIDGQSDNIRLDTGGIDRFVLTSTGKIGIGTTTPAATLDVTGTDAMIVPRGTTAQTPTTPNSVNGMIRYDSDIGKFRAYQGGSWQDILTNAPGNSLAAGSNTQIQFNSNGAFSANSGFVYTSDGNVGIGTTTPTTKLYVNGTSIFNGVSTFAGDIRFSTGDVRIGNGASTGVSGGGLTEIAIGNAATTSGVGAIAIGQSATAVVAGVAIGPVATVTGGPGVAIGRSSTAAANEFVVGSTDSNGMRISNVYFGTGKTYTSPLAYTINGSGASGTDVNGADITIAGGKATGAASGGSILFQTSTAAASSSTLQSLATRMTITSAGNVGIGTTSPTALLTVGATNSAQTTQVTGDLRVGSFSGTGIAYLQARDSSTSSIDLQLRSQAGGVPLDVLRLTSAGNVGIGTTAPTSSLHIAAVAPFIKLQSAPGNYAGIAFTDNGVRTYNFTRLYNGNFAMASNSNSGLMTVDTTDQIGFNVGQAPTLTSLITIKGTGNTSATSALDVQNSSATSALFVRNDSRVGIGTSSPAATLDVAGTDALVVPRGTTAQQPTGPNSVNGMIRYDSDVGKFKAYQAGSWQDILTSGGGALAAAGADRQIQFNSNGSFSAASTFVYSSLGYLGVGTLAPTTSIQIGDALTPNLAHTPAKFLINDTPTNTASTTVSSLSVILQPAPATNSSSTFQGITTDVSVPSSSSVTYGSLFGVRNWLAHAGTGNIGSMYGAQNLANNNSASATVSALFGSFNLARNVSTGTVTTSYGAYNRSFNISTGSIGTAYGTYSDAYNTSSGTITTAYGMYSLVSNAGTITNAYGLYLTKTNTGTITTNYGIYQADASNNYFAGNIGIATTTPTYKLDVAGDARFTSAVHFANGSAAIPSISFAADPDVGMYRATADALAFATNGSEVMRMISGGAVGIGTASPAYKLDVNGTLSASSVNSFGAIDIRGAGNFSWWQLSPSATNNAGTLTFQNINNSYKPLILDANNQYVLLQGRVGVGTATPAATLDVTGTDAMILPRGTTAQQPTTPNSVNGMIRYDSDVNKFKAYQGGSWQDIITSGGGGLAAAGADRQIQFNSNGSFSAASTFVYSSLGNLGVGTLAPAASIQVGDTLASSFGVTPTKFLINDTPTNTASVNVFSTSIVLQPAPTSNSGASFTGLLTDVYVPSSATVNYGILYGSRNWPNYAGTGSVSAMYGTQNVVANSSTSATVANLYGNYNLARNLSTGTVTNSYGAYNRSYNNAAGSMGTAYGTYSDVVNNSTGAITTAYGMYSQISNNNASGSIGTAYGLYLNKTNSGTITNNYGIYQADTSTNYLAGNLGIGTPGPQARLDVGSGNITFGANVITDSTAGLYWHSASPGAGYSIARTSGAWNAPDYQQLQLNWATGIIIDGGNSYGKSGTILQPNGGKVGIGTTAPQATLDVTGTDAMILPRGTTAQQPTGPNSVNGMIRYDSNVNKFKAYQGGSWQDIITSGGGGLAAAGADRQIQFNSNGSFSAASTFVYSSLGYLGVGTISPTASLQIGDTLASNATNTAAKFLINDTPVNTASGSVSSMSIIMQPAAASNSSTTFNGLLTDISVPSSSSVTYGTLYGSRNWINYAGTGNISNMYGLFNQTSNASTSATASNLYGSFNAARNTSTGTVTNSYGALNRSINSSTGAVTSAFGTYSDVYNSNASGTTTSTYGMYSLINNAGTIGTAYGLYLTKTNTGTITNNYGIYQADTANNYFGGNVGIGTTAPTSPLEVSFSSSGGYGDIVKIRNSAVSAQGSALGFYHGPNTVSSGSIRTTVSGAGGNLSGTMELWTTASNVSTKKMSITPAGNVTIAGDPNNLPTGNSLTVWGPAIFGGIGAVSNYPATVQIESSSFDSGLTTGAGFQVTGTTPSCGGCSQAALRYYGSATANLAGWAFKADGYLSTGGGIDATSQMVILKSGNVGIGTTTPGGKLEVRNSVTDSLIYGTSGNLEVIGPEALDTTTVRLGSVNNSYAGLYVGNNRAYVTGDQGAGIGSLADPTMVYVNTNGSVGIGDTTPDSGTGGQLKLDVEGPVGGTKYCDASGNNCFTPASVAGLATVPGSDTQVIFNSNGTYSAASGLLYLSAGSMVSVGTPIAATNLVNQPTNVKYSVNAVQTATGIADVATQLNTTQISLGSTSNARFYGTVNDISLPSGSSLSSSGGIIGSYNLATYSSTTNMVGQINSPTPTGVVGTFSRAVSNSTNTVASARGTVGVVTPTSTGLITDAYGVSGIVQAGTSSGGIKRATGVSGIISADQSSGTGTVQKGYGGQFGVNISNNNVVTDAFGLYSYVSNISNTTVTNAYGGYFDMGNLANSFNPFGTITNAYGVYIGTMAGTNKFSLYASDSATPSYFAGNVGIGTNSPLFALDVGTSSMARFQSTANFAVGSAANPSIAFSSDSKSGFYDVGSGDFAAATNGSGRMLFGSNGNIGIGTLSPNEGKVEVKGGTVCVDTNNDNTASSCIASESDVRLKKNVQDLKYSLNTLMQLRPVSFDWKYNDPEVLKHYDLIKRFAAQPHSVGFIAQDVQKLVPEAIEAETVGDKEVQYLQLDYTKLMPVVVKAVQQMKGDQDQLAAKVETAFTTAQALQADNKAMKDEVAALKAQNAQIQANMDNLSKQVSLLNENAGKNVGKASMEPWMILAMFGMMGLAGLSGAAFFFSGRRNRK